jgi:hypothetical protein
MDGQYCHENTRGAYFSTKFDIPTHFDEILERISSKKRPNLMDGQYCHENTRGAYFSTKCDIPTHFDGILKRNIQKASRF